MAGLFIHFAVVPLGRMFLRPIWEVWQPVLTFYVGCMIFFPVNGPFVSTDASLLEHELFFFDIMLPLKKGFD